MSLTTEFHKVRNNFNNLTSCTFRVRGNLDKLLEVFQETVKENRTLRARVKGLQQHNDKQKRELNGYLAAKVGNNAGQA